MNPNMLRGIDVSANNGAVDWNTVAKQDVHFALVKATEGASFHDPQFQHNYAEIKRVGLLRGAYCFARPKTSGAVVEAESYVQAVKSAGGFDGLPPVLDMEDAGGLSNAELIAWIRAWMAHVKQLTGKQGILYTYSTFIKANGLQGLSDIPLWIADYSDKPPYTGDWKAPTFHQFTESGTIPGVNGHVDMNTFQGTLDDLHALCKLTNVPQTPVVRRPVLNPGGPVEPPKAQPHPAPTPVKPSEPQKPVPGTPVSRKPYPTAE